MNSSWKIGYALLQMAKSSRTLWAQKIAGKLPTPSHDSLPGLLNRKPFDGTVLGIDPSLRGTGLALLEFKPGKRPFLHHTTTVRMKASLSMPECLAEIHRAVTAMLQIEEVRHVALEQTIFVQNFQTAQILGAARGTAIAAAAIHNIPIYEYPPLRIKQAVVGFGRASKEQVSRMIMQYLDHTKQLPFDEADAVSTALCHAFTWNQSEG